MTPEARRQSMIAMDRKRRLTGSISTHEHARRRYTPSEFLTRTDSQLQNSWDANRVHAAPSSGDSNEVRPSEVVDLTGSSPPPPPPPPHSPVRHNQPSRTSSSSSRLYVVPPWQPDSEVTHCPICKRQFHWMFRRHHCRKCGRVVCDSCSPHRITIPRQFIVNPPRPEFSPSPTQAHHETIDLTGEEEEDGNGLRSQGRVQNSSLSILEGGEKVRLCNPCVPDPQPDPPPNFPQFLDEASLDTYGGRLPPSAYQNYSAPSSQANIFGQARRLGNVSTSSRALQLPGHSWSQAPPSQSARDVMTQGRFDYSTSIGSRPRHASATNPYSMYVPGAEPRPGAVPSANSNAFFGGRSGNANTPLLGSHSLFDSPGRSSLPALPGLGQPTSPAYGHGRYSSVDVQPRPPSSFSGRPRGSSMFDLDHRQGMGSPSSHSRPAVPPNPRPRLHERDICPVCRRALPPRGHNGDESAREAHIMSCINARDASASGADTGSSSRGTVHMVVFTSSEKDCVGEEGNAQECSICMVEYEVGDELARLECFCKFHKECIVAWLNRKAECPVHKAARFNV